MRIILVRSLDVVTQVKGLLREVVVVQLLWHVCLFVTPWTATCQASLSFTMFWSLLKFMSIESVMLSNHLIAQYFLRNWCEQYLLEFLIMGSPPRGSACVGMFFDSSLCTV